MRQISRNNVSFVITGEAETKAVNLARRIAITFFQRKRKLRRQVLVMVALMDESIHASATA